MIPRLLVLTDRTRLRAGRGLVEVITDCVTVGLTHVLVRELDLPVQRRADLVAELTLLDGLTVWAAHTHLPGAAGVHVSASGAPPEAGPWGRSCHGRRAVEAAATEGASWATLSPYAQSASKPGRRLLAPSEYADHRLPVLALAGVTPANAAAAIAAGAHGVAVQGAVMAAADPAAVVGELLAVLP